MSDGDNMPPQIPGMDDQSQDGAVQAVPLAALSQPDESDSMQTPQVGDAISMTVDATVVKITGDTAFIRPTAINGTSLNADQNATTPESTDDDTEDSLQNAAQALSNPQQ